VNAEDLWQAEFMNIRDDRIEIFGGLNVGEEVRFVYAVRAVTSGKFIAPGPSVEGMYEPEVWAAETPSRITVQGPWADFL
jgi:uncharacterized protein YfaS (alpha-2-macroglobulin family)